MVVHDCNLSYSEGIGRKITVQGPGQKHEIVSKTQLKQNNALLKW
jgi:hypothetical protein